MVNQPRAAAGGTAARPAKRIAEYTYAGGTYPPFSYAFGSGERKRLGAQTFGTQLHAGLGRCARSYQADSTGEDAGAYAE